MSMAESLWISLALTALLSALHYCMPRLRGLPFVPEHKVASFGGGLAVAYVFLEMLPGFLDSKEAMGKVLAQHVSMTPLVDMTVYLTALTGFVLYFGLDKLARARRTAGRTGGRSFFYLHVGAAALSNFLITYTLPLRTQAGWPFAIVFAAAMGLHFLIVDRHMEEHHRALFCEQGRYLLLGALALGWVLAVATEPDNVFGVALLSSFLGGTVLLNVFKQEIPSESRTSYPWFVTGIALGAVTLLILTAVEG